MMRSIITTAALAAYCQAELVMPVLETTPETAEQRAEYEKHFVAVMDKFLENFDSHSHDTIVHNLIEGNLESFLSSAAFTGEGGPECGAVGGSVAVPTRVSAFPGGATRRVFGMDLAKLVDRLSQAATGAAGTQGVMPSMLTAQAIQTGAGMIKSAMSVGVQALPMLLTGRPMTCLPMVTGHNCAGSILYPITAADFVNADTTDAQLDGVIAGFPTLYKEKVGVTSDAAYKACFSAYMSMKCGSIFPRCAVPNAGQEPGPTGRYPMCFTSCLATLVACPGFWIEDIAGECMDVSVPPMCGMATFFNYWLLPPQYTSYENSAPTSQSCPTVPAALAGIEGSVSGAYDDGAIEASPYAAGSGTRLPVA